MSGSKPSCALHACTHGMHNWHKLYMFKLYAPLLAAGMHDTACKYQQQQQQVCSMHVTVCMRRHGVSNQGQTKDGLRCCPK